MSLFRRLLVWIARFPYRRGYGVHSPFAFRWIKEVVFEKGTYYAYAPLAELFPPAACSRPLRDLRLLFRIANAHRAERCFLLADDAEVVQAYLRTARPRMEFVAAVQPDRPADLCVLLTSEWSDHLPKLLTTATERTLFVLAPITGAQQGAWQQVVADGRTVVTFDLYDFGLAFCDPALNKEHYKVNRAF